VLLFLAVDFVGRRAVMPATNHEELLHVFRGDDESFRQYFINAVQMMFCMCNKPSIAWARLGESVNRVVNYIEDTVYKVCTSFNTY
jgi:hypothetical protein